MKANIEKVQKNVSTSNEKFNIYQELEQIVNCNEKRTK